MRHAKHLLVVCLDALFGSAMVACLLVALARPAYAYVDPSVMTYTIQALAGVAVALSALLGIVWRRLRRVLLRVLHIDENADKLVEPDIHEIKSSDPRRDELLAEADHTTESDLRSLGVIRPEKLRWRARLFFSLVAALLLAFTVLVVAPLEIVAGSAESLYFGVVNVWRPVALFAVGFAVILALLMSALRGRAFNVAFATVIALAVAAYLQVNLLNTGLPPADGTAVAWGDYARITIISAVVWVALIAAFIFASLRKSLAFKGVACFGALALVIAQSIGLGTMLSQPMPDGSSVGANKPYVTKQGLYEVSDKSNVIVIILDTFDTHYLEDLRATDPNVLDEFNGFTYYRNSVGSMIPTRYALASLLTGRTLTDDDECWSNSLIRSWYSEDNLLDEVNDLGYASGVYSTDTANGLTALSEKTENIHSIPNFTGDFSDTIGILGRCALYRDLPWVLKPGFWFYTDDINNAVMPDSGEDSSTSPYLYDDAAYYEELKEQGLSIDDEEGTNGSFRFIHLIGAHGPYTLDENGQYAGEDGSTLQQQCAGSLKIVDEYLRQLKELGVYDQSTIIVTADHGDWYLASDITNSISPILLVKPAGTAEENAEPCQISDALTGHMDLSATLVDAMGGDSSSWGTRIQDATDEPRLRYFDSTSVDDESYVYTSIKEWQIDGDALDFDDWSQTGTEWPIVDD